MDVWSEVGPASNLNLKGKIGENIKIFSPFWQFSAVGVSSKRNERNSSFSLRSTEIGWSESVEPRFKGHLLDEGYVWVSTTHNFVEDFEFGEEKLVRETLHSL